MSQTKTTHKAAQVFKANGTLEIVEKETPMPKEGEILIKVLASGICGSDHFTVSGVLGSQYPLSPGHEVVGRIEKIGNNVDQRFTIGQKVGLGWFGGYCGTCKDCRRGDFMHCIQHIATGVTIDGGHQQFVIANEKAVVDLPQESKMKDSEMAPLLCAGNTVYLALVQAGMKAGDVVLIQGVGGLGHIAIQIARKSGCTVVCLSGSKDKKELAFSLGAHHYLTSDDNLQEEMEKIGKANIALATSPSGGAASSLLPLLDTFGTLVLVGLPADGKSLQINPMQVVLQHLTIKGLTCNTASTNDHFTNWANRMEIKSMVKEWPLEKANEAYQDTMNGNPRFRNVIVM